MWYQHYIHLPPKLSSLLYLLKDLRYSKETMENIQSYESRQNILSIHLIESVNHFESIHKKKIVFKNILLLLLCNTNKSKIEYVYGGATIKAIPINFFGFYRADVKI